MKPMTGSEYLLTALAVGTAVLLLVYALLTVGNDRPRKGDVNGDGDISLIDLLLVQKHILGDKRLHSKAYCAADVNSDELVDEIDRIIIQQYILQK